MSTSYVIDAARTPRGRGKAGKGALSGVHPRELFAQVLKALEARVGFAPAEVDDVIAGCVSQVDEQGANLARNAVLAAGWPIEVTGVTVKINEAFAAVVLQTIRRLGIDPARVNVTARRAPDRGPPRRGHPRRARRALRGSRSHGSAHAPRGSGTRSSPHISRRRMAEKGDLGS